MRQETQTNDAVLHRCAKCDEWKHAEDFYRSRQAKSGLQNWCKDYSRENVKRLYREDPVYRDRIKESARRSAIKHAEKRRKWLAEYERANRDEINARRREWTRNHPEYGRHHANIRRARKQSAAIVPFAAAQLDQRWAYYGGKCWICGGQATCTDHVKPLAKGGAHILANLRPACTPCNARKHDRWPYRRGIEF